ncbi:MAG: TatD family hydrolase [Planctomycetes bacterium]|nr:TatD family hydrolase [Planctomycetota bacterium]
MLIDAHLHLQDPELQPHLEGVLARAATAGVERLVVNGTSEDDWSAVRELAAEHPSVVPCFGVHPWFATERSGRWRQRLREFLESVPSAVGEIGLDRWVTPRDEAAQEELFRAQLALARKLARPVTIHCLKAWDWMMRVLRDEPSLEAGMHFHAFDGPVAVIEPLLAEGACFSFAGNVLAPGRKRARAALAALPLERLLLESDAPDMPPPPAYRTHELRDAEGRILNEPANLGAVVRGLAELKGVAPERLAEATTENARRFFGEILR